MNTYTTTPHSSSFPEMLRQHIRWILAGGIAAGLLLPLGSAIVGGYFYEHTETARVIGGDGSWVYGVVLIGIIVSLALAALSDSSDKRKYGARLIVPSLGWSLVPCLILVWGISEVMSSVSSDVGSLSPGLGLWAIILVAAVTCFVGFASLRQATESVGGIVLFSSSCVLFTWMVVWIILTFLLWIFSESFDAFKALLVCALIGAASWYGTKAGWGMIMDQATDGSDLAHVNQTPAWMGTSRSSGVRQIPSSTTPQVEATHVTTTESTPLLVTPNADSEVISTLDAGMRMKLMERSIWQPRQEWIAVMDEQTKRIGYVGGFKVTTENVSSAVHGLHVRTTSQARLMASPSPTSIMVAMMPAGQRLKVISDASIDQDPNQVWINVSNEDIRKTGFVEKISTRPSS